MSSKKSISSRRSFVKKLAATSLVAFTAKSMETNALFSTISPGGELKGNINHSACRWCYSSIPFEEFCMKAKEIGLKAVDLVGPQDWPVLKKYGLDSSMCNGAEISIAKGWNDKQYHAILVKNYSEMIPLVAKAGYKNLICLSGNRNGMDDETGLNNCVDGLKQVLGIAEKHNVMLIMELLNSKVDHKDYICDHTWWGVELVKRAGSENLRLLYDIYHMQIMEGDIIRTVTQNIEHIGHFHIAGNPGRNNLDDTQELNYVGIMRAIAATGYSGYVGHEYTPLGDALQVLRDTYRMIDV